MNDDDASWRMLGIVLVALSVVVMLVVCWGFIELVQWVVSK